MNHKSKRISNFFSQGETKRLLLFFMVGGMNTVFGYSLYALLLYLHLHYALASLLSCIGGVLFNFKTTGVIVFKSHNNSLLFRFIGVYIVTYVLNVGGLKIFSIYNVNMYMAGAVLVIPIAITSFVLLKKYVFGGDKGEVHQRSDSLLQ